MTRTEIIAALEATRKCKVCNYIGDTCDCKYGIAVKAAEPRSTRYVVHDLGEQTGCPEMRTAIAVLRNMTDQEWEKIQRRMARNAKAAFLKYSKREQ